METSKDSDIIDLPQKDDESILWKLNYDYYKKKPQDSAEWTLNENKTKKDSASYRTS